MWCPKSQETNVNAVLRISSKSELYWVYVSFHSKNYNCINTKQFNVIIHTLENKSIWMFGGCSGNQIVKGNNYLMHRSLMGGTSWTTSAQTVTAMPLFLPPLPIFRFQSQQLRTRMNVVKNVDQVVTPPSHHSGHRWWLTECLLYN